MKKYFSHSKWNRLGMLMVILSLSAGLWLGCSEQTNLPSESGQSQIPLVPGQATPQVQSVTSIQDRYSDILFTIPEVVGTGTGITEDGKLAIVVFTASHVEQRAVVNIESLAKKGMLKVVPMAIENVPVVTKVTGRFKIYADPTARFDRPVPIGVSTGHPDITAGTIGCRVKDSQGNVYALSNNHVYANINDASRGDNVLHPGPYDGGQDPADAIGTLSDFEDIKFDGSNNVIDAAIAMSSTSNLGTSTPFDGYGTPSSTTNSAQVGQSVQKYGRTTGWTQGEVTTINVTVDVCYQSQGPVRCKKLARFVNQIMITPGDFSAGGDSGSLIVTVDGNNPVGLLFAGSSTHTIANPIDAVLDRFKVTIDDGSGGTTNQSPSAAFSFTTTGLTAKFTDGSSDPDGTVVDWSWDFGDSYTSSDQNPNHIYTASETYTVSLTVTDDDGANSTSKEDVTVTNGSSVITLTATGYKVRGFQKVDLTWSGATGQQVEIYRDGTSIATTDNNGLYTDNINNRGGGSYIYMVCEVENSACSNPVTVNF